MKILFSTFGSLGDIHPYLALALEAKRRGHDPIFATSERYRTKIEALGLTLRAVRPDLPPPDEFATLAKRVMDTQEGPRFLFQQLLAPSARVAYEDILSVGADCDLIITHPAAPSGPIAAQKLGIKWVSSVLAPISLWSRKDPPVLPPIHALDIFRFLGPLWGEILVRSGRLASRSWVAAWNQLRHEEGLPPANALMEGQYSPLGNLALFSPHFCAPQADWPANTAATGFCFYDTQGYTDTTPATNDETDWQQWLDNGEAPVVWTLGSSAVYHAGDFWEHAFNASLRVGVRSLFLCGDTASLPKLPPQMLAVSYAPHSQIFPRARLIVHQGGIGTTAQALRAGVPQLILPFAHDQQDNAARLKRLGVGKPIRRRDLPHLPLPSLSDPRYRQQAETARHLGKLIRAENGPQKACETLERLVNAP